MDCLGSTISERSKNTRTYPDHITMALRPASELYEVHPAANVRQCSCLNEGNRLSRQEDNSVQPPVL